MGRVIKDAEASDVTSVSFDDVFAEGADRIPAERVETEAEAEAEPEDVAPQGRVLRSGRAGRSSEPVPVDPDAVKTPDDDASTAPEGETQELAEESQPEVSDPEPTRTEEEWREHLQEQVEAARAEAYEEGREDGYDAGYEDGYEEAEADMQTELEETREQLIADTTRFEQQWEAYIAEAESQLVELSLDLAETIVDAPFTETMRRAAEEALVEAVTELSGAPPVTIRLHPVDCQRVRESGLMDRLTENFDGVALEPEPEFKEGDWSVSSSTGVIRRRRDEVLETLRSELRRASTAADSEPDRG